MNYRQTQSNLYFWSFAPLKYRFKYEEPMPRMSVFSWGISAKDRGVRARFLTLFPKWQTILDQLEGQLYFWLTMRHDKQMDRYI